MRFAQSGGPSVGVDGAVAASAVPAPLPSVPPVDSNADRAPDWKLCFMLPEALDAARRNGDVAAFAPVLATAPRPDATLAAPD